MSLIAPDTTVTLYSDVPITDKKNIAFKTVGDQRSYFHNKVYKTSVECSYEKVGDPLILDIPIADMYRFNYISFKNAAFENKEIYARALQPVYINNETLAVPYVIDDWQTFMFDMQMTEATVLREHLSVADHQTEATYPYNLSLFPMFTQEPLSPSEYYKAKRNVTSLQGDATWNASAEANTCKWEFGRGEQPTTASAIECGLYIVSSQVVDTSQADPEVVSPPFSFDSNGNFPTPVHIERFTSLHTQTQIQEYLNKFVENDCVSSILGIYYLPLFFPYTGGSTTPQKELTIKINYPQNTFKHSKLKRYPYTYLRVTDPMGVRKEYKIERFNVNNVSGEITIKFELFAILNGSPMIILAPVDYDGANGTTKGSWNFQEIMVFNKFPQVAYNTDGYLTWLSQQYRGQAMRDVTAAPWAYNPELALGGAITKTLGGTIRGAAKGAEAGGVAGAVGGGATGFISGGAQAANSLWNFNIADRMHRAGEEYMNNGGSVEANVPTFLADAAPLFMRDEYHPGTDTGALPNYAFDQLAFTFELITPNEATRNRYDDFFTLYGYQVNKFGVPNIVNYTKEQNSNSHPQFENGMTYVKTADCSVEAPTAGAGNNIEQMFDGGHWFIDGSSLVSGGS